MARAYQMADRIAMVVDGEVIVTGNKAQTLAHKDPRVVQFVRGQLEGPLTEAGAVISFRNVRKSFGDREVLKRDFL